MVILMDNESKEIIAATETDGGIVEGIEVFDIELAKDGEIDGKNND